MTNEISLHEEQKQTLEGDVTHEESREINGITITAKRLYRNGGYYIEITCKEPDSDLPVLVTHWLEDPRQKDYYNMFEEVVSELNKFEPKQGTFEEILDSLRYTERYIENQRSDAYFDYMDKQANEAVQEMAKMRILIKGIAKIRDIANELWDGEEEQLRANRLYVAIHELLAGGDFLRQHINDQVLEIAEAKEISLTEEQLENVIGDIEHWMNYEMETLVTELIKVAKDTIQPDYEALIAHTVTHMKADHVPVSVAVELALEQELHGKTGEDIIKAMGKDEFQFKTDVEKSL